MVHTVKPEEVRKYAPAYLSAVVKAYESGRKTSYWDWELTPRGALGVVSSLTTTGPVRAVTTWEIFPPDTIEAARRYIEQYKTGGYES